MDKQNLLRLIQEKEFAYAAFREWADARTATIQWGSGVIEPYSLEPYAPELLGFDRGKMLKNPSAPRRHRYRYSVDSAGRIIYGVAYASLGGKKGEESWIHNDDFYEHYDDHIIQYRFSDVFRDAADTQLSAVTWVVLEAGRVVKSYCIGTSSFSHYTEQTYAYDGDKVVGMRLCWPEGPYPDRNFRVFHEGKMVRIVELAADSRRQEIQIYPAVD